MVQHSRDAGRWQPPFPVSHVIAWVNYPCSTVDCVASVFWILCFEFPHPIVPTKHPSMSPASGEKKRKAITLEVKLKIIAHCRLMQVFWACLK